MKAKRNILSLAINLVMLSAFTAICFLVRKEYTTPFYFSYGVMIFAFLMYVLATYTISKKKEFVILGYSPVIISSVYFIITAILNFLFILFKMENLTVDLVLNIIITAVYLVLFLFNLLGNESIKEDIKKHKIELSAHYNIKDAIIPLKGLGRDLHINKKLESLCDAAASAQIYRNGGAVASIDEVIVKKAQLLKENVTAGLISDNEIVEQIDTIKRLIADRNTSIQQSIR